MAIFPANYVDVRGRCLSAGGSRNSIAPRSLTVLKIMAAATAACKARTISASLQCGRIFHDERCAENLEVKGDCV